MADDRPTVDPDDPGSSPDLVRPKRPPPTLDLAATEISRPQPDAATSEPQADVASRAPETPDVGAASSETPPRRGVFARVFVPALSGALAAALLLGIVTLAQWPLGAPSQETAPAEPANAAALDDLSARLARVESRTAATPPAAAAPDLSAITARLDTLDKLVASQSDDIAAARAQSGQAAATANELKSAPPPAAPPPPDLSAINERLTRIESAARAQAAAMTQQNAKPADVAPLRLTIAASLLDLLVRQGEPYAAALAAAKALAGDAAALRPLDPFAATGVPAAATLGRELTIALAALAPAASSAAPGAGFIDRLQANAARLVKIERTDASPGDAGSSAITARAAAAARQNDIAGAVRALQLLNGADRATIQPWLDKVAARDAALAAASQFATEALSGLAKR